MSSYKYDPELLEEVLNYMSNYNFFNIDTKSLFNFSSSEKEKIDKISNLYLNIKLFNDAKQVTLEELDNDTYFLLTNEILSSFFPKFENYFWDLDKHILLIKDGSVSDAGIITDFSKNGVYVKMIYIPDYFNGYTSSSLIHEKTHCLTFEKFGLEKVCNSYFELFPILIQKLALNEMETKYKLKYVSEYDQIVRINDTRANIYLTNVTKKINNKPDKSPLDSLVYEYYRVKGSDYLLSEIYSNLLVKYYLIDRNTMLEKLNRLFTNKITIDEFLKYYNINLSNKEIIPTIKENTDKVKRLIIS